jgi:hypothetical protein
MPHTPHTEIWSTSAESGAMTGQVVSNTPQGEGQEAPYVVCEGISNPVTAALIANVPELWRRVSSLVALCGKYEQANQNLELQAIDLKALLERAWPYLHDLTTCAPPLMYRHNEVENLIQEIKTSIGHE